MEGPVLYCLGAKWEREKLSKIFSEAYCLVRKKDKTIIIIHCGLMCNKGGIKHPGIIGTESNSTKDHMTSGRPPMLCTSVEGPVMTW